MDKAYFILVIVCIVAGVGIWFLASDHSGKEYVGEAYAKLGGDILMEGPLHCFVCKRLIGSRVEGLVLDWDAELVFAGSEKELFCSSSLLLAEDARSAVEAEKTDYGGEAFKACSNIVAVNYFPIGATLV